MPWAGRLSRGSYGWLPQVDRGTRWSAVCASTCPHRWQVVPHMLWTCTRHSWYLGPLLHMGGTMGRGVRSGGMGYPVAFNISQGGSASRGPMYLRLRPRLGRDRDGLVRGSMGGTGVAMASSSGPRRPPTPEGSWAYCSRSSVIAFILRSTRLGAGQPTQPLASRSVPAEYGW